MSYLLSDSVRVLDGVGPKIAEALESIGVLNLRDLVFSFPLKYVDASKPVLFANESIGLLCAYKVVVDQVKSGITAKKRLKIVTANVHDQSGTKAKIIWYNQPYRANQLHVGAEILIVGVTSFDSREGFTCIAPRVLLAPEILPLYRRSISFPSGTLRKLVQQALLHVSGQISAGLPSGVMTDDDFSTAIQTLHSPENIADIPAAKMIMAKREGWQYFASLWLRTQGNKKSESYVIEADGEFISQVVKTLPFELSPSQKRAIWDSAQDMASGKVMTRLLNGDVGSGKTVVAGVLACLVAKAGYRTVFMAPTDLLATQHTKKLQELFKQAGLRVAQWSRGNKDEKAIDADLVVGTQALLYSGAPVENVALRVVDEQHRYGVLQRTNVGGKLAHFLSTTATPIPRTLMLTLLSGVDVSKLTSSPARLTDRNTLIVSTVDEYRIIDDKIAEAVARHEQVFIVCPSISPVAIDDEIPLGDTENKRSAEGEFIRVQKQFPHAKVALVHGKIASAEREAVMAAFAEGSIDILVATTVVEVGVDVPNATLMVIHNADRFGIAQLHQLRGRIGRGAKTGTCILAVQGKVPSRILTVAGSDNGFELAEADLAERGSGDLVGVQQSGSVARFQFLEPSNIQFLQELRDEVFIFAETAEQSVLLDIVGVDGERIAD